MVPHFGGMSILFLAGTGTRGVRKKYAGKTFWHNFKPNKIGGVRGPLMIHVMFYRPRQQKIRRKPLPNKPSRHTMQHWFYCTKGRIISMSKFRHRNVVWWKGLQQNQWRSRIKKRWQGFDLTRMTRNMMVLSFQRRRQGIWYTLPPRRWLISWILFKANQHPVGLTFVHSKKKWLQRKLFPSLYRNWIIWYKRMEAQTKNPLQSKFQQFSVDSYSMKSWQAKLISLFIIFL